MTTLYFSTFVLFITYFVYSLVQIDDNVQREIINHRSLKHPNIIRFKEVSQDLHDAHSLVHHSIFSSKNNFSIMYLQVILTPTHLAIVMEYASGGELFERICKNVRFSEDEVRTISLVHPLFDASFLSDILIALIASV